MWYGDCVYMYGSWIDSRMLHKELKVGKDFTTWLKGRIGKYDFIENEDYKVCFPKRESKKGSGGHNTKDYSITLDMAKELSMVENNKIRISKINMMTFCTVSTDGLEIFGCERY